MTNSADQDQLASSELIWIYTVCKDRVYPGSAGLGLRKQNDNCCIVMFSEIYFIAPDETFFQQKSTDIFLISHGKHMVWVHIRSASLRYF